MITQRKISNKAVLSVFITPIVLVAINKAFGIQSYGIGWWLMFIFGFIFICPLLGNLISRYTAADYDLMRKDAAKKSIALYRSLKGKGASEIEAQDAAYELKFSLNGNIAIQGIIENLGKMYVFSDAKEARLDSDQITREYEMRTNAGINKFREARLSGASLLEANKAAHIAYDNNFDWELLKT